MDFKLFKTDTNFWIILGTIAFLAVGYIFYLKYYKAGKEDRITSTRFRVLDQIGDNLDARLSVYINNVIDQKEKIEIELDSIRDKIDSKILADSIDYRLKQRDFNRDLQVVDFVHDSVAGKINLERSKEHYFITLKIDSFSLNINSDSVIKFLDPNVVIEVPYNNLMEDLPREDVFDGLILIRDSFVIHNTLDQDMIMTYASVLSAVIEPARNNESKSNENNSSNTSENNIKQDLIFSGTAFDIVISNKSYKAFLKPVEVSGETWYIVGLMENSNYSETSRSTSPLVIVSLSLLLILIILALPVIKLKVISKTESLETGTIVNIALSAILGGSLLILFAFFLIQNSSRNHDVDHHLADLSNDIHDSFTGEITKVFKQLDAYDYLYYDSTNLHFKDFKNFKNSENRYNTNVRKDILNDSMRSYLYPSFYEYADYYFWVGENGIQTAYLTPFNEFGTMSDLSSRDYVQKKDEWYFTKDDTVKFRLESIVSVSSGKVKVAMSMPSENSRDSVVALTSRFYSIIDPIIPKDYKFCIIDKSGKVWFHSDITRNLNENFIAECNENKHLSAAIYRDIPKAISANYYNNPYRIHISPMDHLPLYLITFYNKKAERSFQAQVITLTLMLMGTLFFMLFIQTVALLIINRRFQWSHDKKTIMNLTRPMKHLNGTYQYLMKVNVGISILFMLFMAFLRDFHAIIAVFTFAIYMFAYHHWMLNDNESQKKVRIWFSGFNILLLLIVNIVGFHIKDEGFGSVIGFQGAIIAIIAFFHLSVKPNLSVNKKNYDTNYIRSLAWLLILFGILPSLKFYEISNNKEVEIQARHMQIDLMHQRETRNEAIGKYYNRVEESHKVLQIQEKRKERGIYTDFLNQTSFDPSVTPFSKKCDSISMDSCYWDKLVSYLRPFYDEYNLENKYLILNCDTTSGMKWRWKENDTLLFKYVSLTEDPKNRKLHFNTIKSHIPQLLFFKPYSPFHSEVYDTGQVIIYNALFWIMVLGILYLFFQLIRFGTRNIFSLHIIEHYSHESFIEHIHRYLIAGNKLMITRLSSIDKTDAFRQEFSKTYDSFTLDWSDIKEVKNSLKMIQDELEEFKKRVVKFINIPKEQQAKSKQKIIVNKSLVVFINHFDWGYKNPAVLSEKLKMVNQIGRRIGGIQLVLLSQSNENTISGNYQKLIDQKEGTQKEQEIYKKLIAAFNDLLYELEVVRQPVNYKRTSDEENTYYELSLTDINKELIEKELDATDYLKQLKLKMKDYIPNHDSKTNNQISYQDIIKKIDVLVEKYYSGLLELCSNEERHVLYDFADDLIVNPRNKDSILNLMEKGLLIKDYDRLNFFNASFRRFLLNSKNRVQSGETEVKMKKETGTWKGYRIMITIIIVALFIFIAMAKQDFFDNLNKLFVIIAGGITAIINILGLLSHQNKSTGE
ncbi:MAG: hypothetical protein ABFS38_14815 [Bacteroidota bacterium]